MCNLSAGSQQLVTCLSVTRRHPIWRSGTVLKPRFRAGKDAKCSDISAVNGIKSVSLIQCKCFAEKRWRSWLKSSFPESGLNQNIVVLTVKLQYCVPQAVIKVMNTQSYCRIARRRYNIEHYSQHPNVELYIWLSRSICSIIFNIRM